MQVEESSVPRTPMAGFTQGRDLEASDWLTLDTQKRLSNRSVIRNNTLMILGICVCYLKRDAFTHGLRTAELSLHL